MLAAAKLRAAVASGELKVAEAKAIGSRAGPCRSAETSGSRAIISCYDAAAMPARPVVPIVVPLMVIIMGLLFVVFGAAKPEFIWETGKVRTGREAIGDRALGAIFMGFGALFAGMGGLLLCKRR